MKKEKIQKSRTRRNVLKLLGTTSSASILSAGAAAATRTNSEKGRTLRPNTTGLDTLDTAEVTISAENVIRIRMGGTVEPGTPARGYKVEFHDLHDKKGNVQADRVQAAAKQLPTGELPDRANERAKKEAGNRAESGTVADQGSKQGTGEEGDGPQVMADGGDNQSDYEGGCWVRSEDPPDLDLCMTKFWMVWDSSGSNVDWNEWRYTYAGYDTAAWTSWFHTDDWFGSSNFSGNDVTADMGANYRNWDWSWDHNKTEAHHRLNLSGDPDGSLTWWTDQWHTGEDAGILRTDTGHYTYGQV